MDITFSDSGVVDKNEDILIHLFFNIVDYDYRNGSFSDDSSIHDMGSCGFTDEDYLQLAQLYNDTCPKDYIYSEGQDFYQQLSNEHFDNMVIRKFESIYGITIDKHTHYLKDFVALLNEHFPSRNWSTENIFILRTLDNRLINEEKEILEISKKLDQKILKLPIKKKLSPEEVRNGLNEYRMMNELGMTRKEAHELAKFNFDKKHEGKKFQPYLP